MLGIKRTIKLVVAGALLATAVAAPAWAGGVSGTTDFATSFFYGEGETGPIILLQGPSLADGCLDIGVDVGEAKFRALPTGEYSDTAIVKSTQIQLFESDGLPAPVWLGMACEAVITGGDVPEPLAVGEGRIMWQSRTAGDTIYVHNSTTGWVTTPDGDTMRVHGWANYNASPTHFELEKVGLTISK